MKVPAFPIVLSPGYTCQGTDARGGDWFFDDLLREGQTVELRGYRVDGKVVSTCEEGELCVVSANSKPNASGEGG